MQTPWFDAQNKEIPFQDMPHRTYLRCLPRIRQCFFSHIVFYEFQMPLEENASKKIKSEALQSKMPKGYVIIQVYILKNPKEPRET